MKYGLGRTAGASTIKLYGFIFREKIKLSTTKFHKIMFLYNGEN